MKSDNSSNEEKKKTELNFVELGEKQQALQALWKMVKEVAYVT